MEAWRNFDPDQIKAIGEILPPLGEAAEAASCPSCGNATLRWYSYLNPFRQGSLITYIWCGTSRLYYGETTAIHEWDLPDPFDGASRDDRFAMSSDLDKFFAQLDELWRSGDLPQVRRPAH
jgi:hypothetical protein